MRFGNTLKERFAAMRWRVDCAFRLLICLLMLQSALTACGGSATAEVPGTADENTLRGLDGQQLPPVELDAGARVRVVATTNIVADVVKSIGGERIDLKALMPTGADPHSFEPTPKDIAAVSDAHVVFASGGGLEQFLEPLLESAGAADRVVQLSDGIDLLMNEEWVDGETDQGESDPHTWMDPGNVITWAHNIETTLSELDPGNIETYEANGQAYRVALEDLDSWIEAQINQIPEVDRKLVVDHATFGYFARRYGFQMTGAVIPGFSSMSEPSAQDIAQLEDAIRDQGVKAVFVGETVNPNLAQRVAEDTGVQLVSLYTGSLSAADGPASSYLGLMRYNVSQILDTLK